MDFTIPKEEWGEGPWLNEPDEAEWVDPDTGLTCRIFRNEVTGTLNGYVFVPDDHPVVGSDIADPICEVLRVHGGVTWSGHLWDQEPWSVGFDTMHGWDLGPLMQARLVAYKIPGARLGHETYRDWMYVTEQVQLLAAQLDVLYQHKDYLRDGTAQQAQGEDQEEA